MAEISDPNYETISATCDRCGEQCIFSRIDDLAEIMPIAGRRVVCHHCQQEFWIKGDRINTAYQFLLDDAKDHFRRKRYMPAIASIAQAWEVFFSACATSTYVYRPFFALSHFERDPRELNRLNRSLHDVIKPFTFFPMRNLVANLLIQQPRPMSLADAATGIAELKTFGNTPSAESIAGISVARLRETTEGLMNLTIGRLRNNVVHKNAYRPTRAEVEPCLNEEISILYRVKHRLGVGDLLEHQADAVYMEE